MRIKDKQGNRNIIVRPAGYKGDHKKQNYRISENVLVFLIRFHIIACADLNIFEKLS